MTQTHIHQHAHDSNDTDIFGFWLYILSDCILFSVLFATFAVLRENVYGGPALGGLANLHYIFAESLLLLTSSFTFGFAMLSLYKSDRAKVLSWLLVTILLGISFVGMEINEFVNLIHEGHSWKNSAALSSFFTLVGTHGLHVFIGLMWMIVLSVQVMSLGMTDVVKRRLIYLGLFWAFLDIVWIFVFTVVYLMGAV